MMPKRITYVRACWLVVVMAVALIFGIPARAQFVCGGSSNGGEPQAGAGANATGSLNNLACGTNATGVGNGSSTSRLESSPVLMATRVPTSRLGTALSPQVTAAQIPRSETLPTPLALTVAIPRRAILLKPLATTAATPRLDSSERRRL